MSWKSIWGVQAWLRIVINVFMWAPMAIVWALTLIDIPAMYDLLGLMMQGVAYIWFARTLIIILW